MQSAVQTASVTRRIPPPSRGSTPRAGRFEVTHEISGGERRRLAPAGLLREHRAVARLARAQAGGVLGLRGRDLERRAERVELRRAAGEILQELADRTGHAIR